MMFVTKPTHKAAGRNDNFMFGGFEPSQGEDTRLFAATRLCGTIGKWRADLQAMFNVERKWGVNRLPRRFSPLRRNCCVRRRYLLQRCFYTAGHLRRPLL